MPMEFEDSTLFKATGEPSINLGTENDAVLLHNFCS